MEIQSLVNLCTRSLPDATLLDLVSGILHLGPVLSAQVWREIYRRASLYRTDIKESNPVLKEKYSTLVSDLKVRFWLEYEAPRLYRYKKIIQGLEVFMNRVEKGDAVVLAKNCQEVLSVLEPLRKAFLDLRYVVYAQSYLLDTIKHATALGVPAELIPDLQEGFPNYDYWCFRKAVRTLEQNCEELTKLIDSMNRDTTETVPPPSMVAFIFRRGRFVPDGVRYCPDLRYINTGEKYGDEIAKLYTLKQEKTLKMIKDIIITFDESDFRYMKIR